MTHQELENFKPYYYISTGEDNIMYTLNYAHLDYAKGIDNIVTPFIRHNYNTNLSTDYNKAVVKAKEIVGNERLILEGQKETNEWGTGSNKKVEYDNSAWLEQKEQRDKELEEAARQEKESYEKAEPVPVTGERIKFEGVVLGVKKVETQWGSTAKCLFQDDRGFKVWGGYVGERGERLSFLARVQVSEDDAKFGFFTNPSEVIEEGQDERDIKNYMIDFFDWGRSKYTGASLKSVYKLLTEERLNNDDWWMHGFETNRIAFNCYWNLQELDSQTLDAIANKILDKLGVDYLNT